MVARISAPIRMVRPRSASNPVKPVPGWAISTDMSFWKTAAMQRKGMFSRTKFRATRPLPMDMSTRPPSRSCAGLTCGPPGRSSTSSRASRYRPAAWAW